MGKFLDIVNSRKISTRDVNKTHNSILNIPWFHTLDSPFPQKEHDIMGEIFKQKPATTNSFCVMVKVS